MRYPFVFSTCREDKYRPIGENGGAAGTPGEMNQTLVGAQVRESFFAKQAAKLYVETAEGIDTSNKNENKIMYNLN